MFPSDYKQNFINYKQANNNTMIVFYSVIGEANLENGYDPQPLRKPARPFSGLRNKMHTRFFFYKNQ